MTTTTDTTPTMLRVVRVVPAEQVTTDEEGEG